MDSLTERIEAEKVVLQYDIANGLFSDAAKLVEARIGRKQQQSMFVGWNHYLLPNNHVSFGTHCMQLLALEVHRTAVRKHRDTVKKRITNIMYWFAQELYVLNLLRSNQITNLLVVRTAKNKSLRFEKTNEKVMKLHQWAKERKINSTPELVKSQSYIYEN